MQGSVVPVKHGAVSPAAGQQALAMPWLHSGGVGARGRRTPVAACTCSPPTPLLSPGLACSAAP